jgi:glycosyltransferase involved in cell wall biosynthesis
MENILKSLTVLIPAYKPETALVTLAKELLGQGFNQVVVVDDGSGTEYSAVFDSVEQLGCRVLRHAVNMGKGRALKTGLNDILVNYPGQHVITADADGQHLLKDIINVGKTLLENENTIVIGRRAFFGSVPLKSRFGNTITKHVFNFVSGQKIHDTQTGLRGLPASSLKSMLTLTGERYEYEMDMLLEASRFGLTIKEIDIETVYIDKNSSSHFNPLKDSFRIYRLIVLFAGSSLFAFLIDFLLYALLIKAFPQQSMLWIPVAGARVVSSAINFMINRNVIFSKGKNGNLRKHVIRYYWLVAVIMILNYSIIFLLRSVGVNELVAKLIAELLLFFLSYTMQKRVVFK